MAKSALAKDSTLLVIYKSQLDSWSHIVQLFQSMVTSVAFFSIQVWGLRYLNDLKKIQNTFYKQLFCLPKCTPEYALRIEIATSHLSVLIFKLILNWVERILKMEDNRLPKIAYKRLKALNPGETKKFKFNWTCQLGSIFEEFGEGEAWETLSLETLLKFKSRWITLYESHLKQEDFLRAQSYSSLCLYPYLEMKNEPHFLINKRVPLNDYRLFIQLKLFNKYQLRLVWNKKFYYLKRNEHCDFCMEIFNEKNYILHILIECRKIKEERKKIIKNTDDLSELSDTLLEILNNPDCNSVRKIAKFLLKVIL